ncbi:gluconolactonase [Allorhodopirellula solitaria]|nr:gluconolactonase [Allorhodopirellula solitaria]
MKTALFSPATLLSRTTQMLSTSCCWILAGGAILTPLAVQGAPPAAVSGDEATAAEQSTEPTATIQIFGDAGTLVVPADFKKAKKANNIIDHEFSASAGEGEDVKTARLTMMPASGGVDANIDRWIGQFSGTSKKVKPTQETESGKWNVYVVEISGDFAERMGGGPFAGGRFVKRSDYAMIGAILVEPDQDSPGQPEFAHHRQYFVKMIGPAPVIAAHGKAFKKMVHSVGK